MLSTCGRNSRLEHSASRLQRFFFFLIEMTQLTIKNNASLASKLQKAPGQNLTSLGTGQGPAAATVQLSSRTTAPRDQLSVGFWSQRRQMCLPANVLVDGTALQTYCNQMAGPRSHPANRWWLHASTSALESHKSPDSIPSLPRETPCLPTGQEEGLTFSITLSEEPGSCQDEVLLES